MLNDPSYAGGIAGSISFRHRVRLRGYTRWSGARRSFSVPWVGATSSRRLLFPTAPRTVSRPLLLSLLVLCISSLTASPGAAAGQRRDDGGARVAEAGRSAAARRADIQRARAAAAIDGPGAAVAAMARAAGFDPSPGDLLTSVGATSMAVQLVLRPNSARVRTEELAESFVSRGIDHDVLSGRIAIAAVSKVILFDPALETTTVLEAGGDDEPFGFVNDVLFDDEGNLLIADQGVEPTGKEPADGRVWQYDPVEATWKRVAGKRALSNPAFLATDSRGRILFVDLEAGPLMSNLLELRWDAVFLVKGAKRKGARALYRGEGIQATAFDIGPDGRMWFGSFAEIQILDGKSLSTPCSITALPFEFVTGVEVIDESQALLSDGADLVTGNRFIREVDDTCTTRVRVKGKRVVGVRGLARVGEPAEEPSP